MKSISIPRFGPAIFLLSLIGIMVLSLFSETVIFLKNASDLQNFAPAIYYALIVSFLLVTPALWLPSRISRVWVGAIGVIFALATVVVGFQAVTLGARWDLTAHSALMQTYPRQAVEFSAFFGTNPSLLLLLLVLIAFLAMVIVNLRSEIPAKSWATVWTLAGFLIAGVGISNFWKYGRHFIREVPISADRHLRLAVVTENSFHPVTLLALTHFNFRSTHDYFLEAYRHAAENREMLMGAESRAGATSPRILLVVLGESAGRNHWSLYGYPRNTTPGFESIRDELIVFTDVISTQVGTQESVRAIFNVVDQSQPIFPLFAGGGYETHWYSTKPDQGIHDTEISAIVQSCEHRVYLNGEYDGNLVALVEKAVKKPGRHAIFLNLFGSHVRYGDRYPADQAVFAGDDEKTRLIAEYDNSIRYTDTVMMELVNLLKQRDESSALLYVSDHAEDIYDSTPDRYLFRNDSLATNPMYEVPLVVWLSSQYRQLNPEFTQTMVENRENAATTNELYQTMIDLARLTHPIYNPRISLFSRDYEETERRVGSMNRVYTKEESSE